MAHKRAACLLAMMLGANGRPTGCNEDTQCATDSYCSAELLCRECLRCDLLNRESSSNNTACIRSVAQCGPCFRGMTSARMGDVTSRCVLPLRKDTPELLPPYVWIVIVACVTLISILAYLRRVARVKVIAATRASLRPVVASSPLESLTMLPPPPYAPRLDDGHDFAEDESNETVASEATPWRPNHPRQRCDSQAARVFNNPHYVQAPIVDDCPDREQASNSLINGQDMQIIPNNTDSGWPSEQEVRMNGSIEGALLGQVVSIGQISSNNTGGREGDHSPSADPGPSITINVIKNINTVQQHNEFTL